MVAAGIHGGGVFHLTKRWRKMPITACFMDGDRVQRSYVARIAQEWTLYGNVDFEFGSLGNPTVCAAGSHSDVRVSFRQAGFWAFVGTDALSGAEDQPTVNLEFRNLADESVVNGQFQGEILHEFGHVLGFDHALRNPGGHCREEIDMARLYAFGESVGLPKAQVDDIFWSNVEPGGLHSGVFDNQSIMNYSLPPAVFKAGISSPCYSPAVQTLSIRDKIAVGENY
jgi:hypothetical protein